MDITYTDADVLSDKKKILAISDYHTTGIAESLLPILHHWHREGHEISQLGLGYNGWSPSVDKEKFPWYERLLPLFASNPNDRFGQGMIAKALDLFKPDIVITAFDVWMVGYLAIPERDPIINEITREILAHEKRTFKHIAYFPIDGAVEGRLLPQQLGELICGFDVPVTYSKFAQKVIDQDIHLPVPFIPIAHDPAIYHPEDRKGSRKRLGLPDDKFIVGMVATNQYRKSWGLFFDAVIPFARAHPDVTILPWTTWNNKVMGGHEIGDLVWRGGIEDQTIDPKEYIGKFNDTGMADLYRSLDVCVLLTIGEGAGLPPIRARACGTPVLVSDNTSNTEFSTHEFELIPNKSKFYDPYGSNLERYQSDVKIVTKKLHELYENKELREEMSAAGIIGSAPYEIANVMPLWDRVLENATK